MATLVTPSSRPQEPTRGESEARPNSSRRFWTIVALLTLLGLALSVAHIYAYRNETQVVELETGGTVETKLRGDGWVFHAEANLIADGEGFIDPAVHETFGERREFAPHPPLCQRPIRRRFV